MEYEKEMFDRETTFLLFPASGIPRYFRHGIYQIYTFLVYVPGIYKPGVFHENDF
jgi:hypothetical protein